MKKIASIEKISYSKPRSIEEENKTKLDVHKMFIFV
jgi:hypothetical protein